MWLFLYFFAHLPATQLFAGKMHYCADPSFPPATPRYGIVADNGTVIVEPCDKYVHFEDVVCTPLRGCLPVGAAAAATSCSCRL